MKRIGIIGGGHLGVAVARLLVSKGYDNAHLRISLREVSADPPPNFSDAVRTQRESTAVRLYPSSDALARLAAHGLTDFFSTNSEMAAASDIVIVSVRPSDVPALGEQFVSQGLSFAPLTKVLSPIAGWERLALSRLFAHPVHRAMLSGAPGIEKGEGVCAIYPEDGEVYDFFDSIGLHVFGMSNESLLHIFTAGVCLTAAFLQAQVDNVVFDDEEVVTHFSELLPDFPRLYAWAKSTVPAGLSKDQIREYIGRLATKGGVTEPIVAALHEGAGMIAALERGVARSQEIADQAGGVEHEFTIAEVKDEEPEPDQPAM